MGSCLPLLSLVTYFWLSLELEYLTLDMAGPFKICIRDCSALRDLISKCFCFVFLRRTELYDTLQPSLFWPNGLGEIQNIQIIRHLDKGEN